MRLTFPMLGDVARDVEQDTIVAALRAGDASAIAPFVDRFFRSAARIAMRYVGEDSAPTFAWDALSDLALELLGGRHRHARLAYPAAYVCTAVRHHVLAALRSESRRAKRHDMLEQLEAANMGQAVSQATYRAAHGGMFDVEGDAFPSTPVPPLTPAALNLMTWVGDGWTQQQIADELHIEREAAKKRIARTKRRLQDALA